LCSPAPAGNGPAEIAEAIGLAESVNALHRTDCGPPGSRTDLRCDGPAAHSSVLCHEPVGKAHVPHGSMNSPVRLSSQPLGGASAQLLERRDSPRCTSRPPTRPRSAGGMAASAATRRWRNAGSSWRGGRAGGGGTWEKRLWRIARRRGGNHPTRGRRRVWWAVR